MAKKKATKKPKAAPPKVLPPSPFVKGQCAICNGEGQVCNGCGEAFGVCDGDCVDGESVGFGPCRECNNEDTE